MSNEDFYLLYSKVNRRDKQCHQYYLNIKFIVYKYDKNELFNSVVLENDNILGESTQLKDGDYVVYDPMTDAIKLMKEKYFLKHYRPDNRQRINLEQLKLTRDRLEIIFKSIDELENDILEEIIL